MNGDPFLLLPDEVALMLRVPVSWVITHARSGDLPHHRIGRHIRFTEQDIKTYLARTHTTRPPLAVVQPEGALRPTGRARRTS